MTQDPLVLAVGATIASQLLATDMPANTESLVSPTFDARRPDWQVAGSMDGNWLVVRHIKRRVVPEMPGKVNNRRQKAN